MNHHHQRVYLLMALLLVLFLAGCWDRVEIEDRGFVVGAAVDLPKKSAKKNEIKLTNQFVVPSGWGSPSQGSSGEDPAYANIAATGKSLFAIDRKMAAMTSRSPYLSDMKLIAVSSELAKTKLFENVMDLFIRDQEMRRGVKVVIAEGDAAGILNIVPESEKLPVMHIESVMENNFQNLGNLKPLRVGDLHERLLGENSFIIPKVMKKGDSMKYQGAAVFHGNNNRMVGAMNVQETKGYNLLTGEVNGGSIKVKHDDESITLELKKVNSSMKVRATKKPVIDVSIHTEAHAEIAESFTTNSLRSEKKFRAVEKKAKKKMEQLMKTTIQKAQEDWKTDILGVGEKLHKYHYDVWQTVKKDWDKGKNYFSEANIDVTANINIQTTGITEQTK
ncbi:Ger(x)C family spore germination protein [Lentibacillus cibarius]|uniref:Ger(X)C family spore germination protein n=1 Tax=Lentibacillus cibarius TaxID=2583219 RepID=A0A5S3QM67_9BACI|nr:Ger(x)C family spore germination protein [Lentibacillus cibarius]TMN22758.1 Ger(x)C family spore germination protein [Lentibacillus cibarius]